MSASYFESFEFKYSVRKLLVWIALAAICTAIGVAVILIIYNYLQAQNYPWRLRTFLFRTSASNYPVWAEIVLYVLVIATTIGLASMIEPIGRMIARKRVFLRLTASGIQHNVWRTYFRIIPYVEETLILWDGILDAKIKRNLFFGTNIRLTLSEIKKGRNRTHDISTTGSEHGAEHILQVIRMNMSNL